MKKYLLFINPEALYREEQFGGIIKINFQMFILGKEEYLFLKKIKSYYSYQDLNAKERKIANILLNKQILLKIEYEKGKKIIKELKK